MSRALVVIPVLGHAAMTHALLADLRDEAHLVDVVVVDNGGDYPSFGDETVLRPATNLGWAGGTNLGTGERQPAHEGVIWLNNDTRLSRNFVAGLLRAAHETGAGVVGPSYDCFWRHQQPSRLGPAADYRPRRRHRDAPFVDGTCTYVTAATLDAIGVLDADTFAPVGWGADLDYCFRAKAAGHRVIVTELSYLNHQKSVTGQAVYDGLVAYATAGHPVLLSGLEAKWGPDWRALGGIDASTGQTAPPRRRRSVRWPLSSSTRTHTRPIAGP